MSVGVTSFLGQKALTNITTGGIVDVANSLWKQCSNYFEITSKRKKTSMLLLSTFASVDVSPRIRWNDDLHREVTRLDDQFWN